MPARLVLRRLLMLFPVLLGMSVVSFSLLYLIPGDVVTVIAGAELAPDSEAAIAIRQRLHLDQPLPAQYLIWIGNVLQGDFGTSLVRGTPVATEILAHLPVTLALTVMSLLLSVVVGIPLGVKAAISRGRSADMLLRLASLFGMAIPTFFAGVAAVLFFSLFVPSLQLFRSLDFADDFWGSIGTLVLPSVVLSLTAIATIMRYTRGAMLEVLNEQFIATARAKGASPTRVLIRHALRTALLPVITASGLIAAQLVSGVVVVEQIFGLPGLGQLMLSAISSRDYTMVQGCVIVVGAMVVLINLAVDMAYHLLDPRI